MTELLTQSQSLVPDRAAPRPPLRVELIDETDALAGLESVWDELAEAVPFRSWQWLECWWRHYRQPRRRLFVLTVRDADGCVVGIAPWYVERSRGGARVVRLLGCGEVCSEYLSLLSAERSADDVVAALADWLAGPGAPLWDLVELTGIAADDPRWILLRRQMERRGHAVHQRDDLRCWRNDLAETWEGFLAGVSRSRRERTRQMVRRKWETGRAVRREAVDAASLAQGFAILVDLHQKRRRALNQPGCFASRRFTDFHREVMGRLLARNQLRLVWTELDGRPVSVEYSLAGGDTLYFYQSGFEPDAARDKPGWLGLVGSFRAAIAAGYRHYDFLRGDEPYKASWLAQPVPLVQLRIVGRGLGARLRHAAWRGRERAKVWARALRALGRRSPAADSGQAGGEGES